MAVQRICNAKVGGSSPLSGTTRHVSVTGRQFPTTHFLASFLLLFFSRNCDKPTTEGKPVLMHRIGSLLTFLVLPLIMLLASSAFAVQKHGAADGSEGDETAQSKEAVSAGGFSRTLDFFKHWLHRDWPLFSFITGRQRPSDDVPVFPTAEYALDEPVTAHFESIRTDALIKYLAPSDWAVHFDLQDERLEQLVVFHAETSRRRALDSLLSRIGLQGIFYPHSRIIIIAQGSEP